VANKADILILGDSIIITIISSLTKYLVIFVELEGFSGFDWRANQHGILDENV
jgi:hypothetical protein